MRYRKLGRTNLQVSEIGFGAWAIGGNGYGVTDDRESLAALEKAWERGVNFYDTADTYGQGHSETLVAQFLKGKPRHEVILASKCGWDFYHGGSRKNFDPDYIRFACAESLKRLQVEAIDLYQLHNPSLELICAGHALAAMEELKGQGKIRFIGISVHTPEEALRAIEDGRVDTLQLKFNLLDQRMEEKVLEAAKDKNIGVVVREPLAYGFLTGKYAAGHSFEKDDHRRRFTRETIEANLKKIERLKQVLGTERLTLARAALEYVLQFEQVSTVIPGAKTPAQVFENTEASIHPALRIEEASHLREIYQRDPLFKEGFF